MTLAKNIFLFLLIVSLLFTISCSKKECEKTLDCDQKECFTTSCVDGTCSNNPKTNCCGNGLKDDIEDGKPGNECTCPEDYGKCGGKTGEFLGKSCINDECVSGVSEGNIKRVRLSEERSFNGIEIILDTEYDKPYVRGVSNFSVTISVTDLASYLKPPIVITKLRLIEGTESLIGVKDTNLRLYDVHDKVSEIIPIIYDMDKSEEEKKIKLYVNYEYNKPYSTKEDGKTVMKDKIYRTDFSESYTDEIIIVNPSIED